MKRTPFVAMALVPLLSCAAVEPGFNELFDGIVTDRLDVYFFHDAPYVPFPESGNPGADRMLAAIHSLSNHVDEAVSMLPSALTNEVRRHVLLTMAGHAGTNAYFRVWDALLDAARSNGDGTLPDTIDDFRCAATTPLYEYVTFHYDLPVCQDLLARTRDLFPTNNPRRAFIIDVITGDEKQRSIDYYLDSGEGLPWFAR